MKENRISYTKKALTLSLCLMLVWGILGTGTTIAWFTDTTPVHENRFTIGELDLVVSHKLKNGSYEIVEESTKVLDDEALYEPGYVQVVYLKVENKGDVPFEYQFSVDVNDVTVGKSVLGNDIYLPNYLRFGVMFSGSEAELDRELSHIIAERKFAEYMGEYPLNTYSQKDDVVVPVDGTRYIALVVRMPEEVGNAANYRGSIVPMVDLGLHVTASQEGTLE